MSALPSLSLSNVALLGSTSSNAILIWLMNEGSGTVLNDSSVHLNTATTNGGWSNSAPPPGASAYQTFLASSSQTASSNTGVSFLSSSVITLDFWAQSSLWATSSGTVLVTTTTSGFRIFMSGGGLMHLNLYDSGGLVAVYNLTAPLDTSWHHFQIVLNNLNGTIQAYLDSGSNAAVFVSSTWTTPSVFATAALYVASLLGIVGFFTGNMSQVKVLAGDAHTL